MTSPVEAFVPGRDNPPDKIVYWQVSDELCIGCSPKAGATSIMNTLNRNRCKKMFPHMIRDAGLRVRLYLRHPITRFASVWAYFTPVGTFPKGHVQGRSRPHDIIMLHPTLEEFTDAVLSGVMDPHWQPQVEHHRGNVDEYLRFEDINDTFPFELLHMNAGRMEKPEITYRRAELEDYYREDLDAWQRAAA